MVPLLTTGMVYARRGVSSLSVLLNKSGQSPVVVQYGRHGPFDSVRVRQKPMPTRGTWGLIAFPNNDVRNGIWICSIPASFADALHDDNTATNADVDYESLMSGFWKLIDGTGNLAIEWPDGTTFVLGSSLTLPTVYRHTVNANQTQSRAPFTEGQRVASPPSSFSFQLSMKSGLIIACSSSGDLNITTPGATALNITAFTVNINGSAVNVPLGDVVAGLISLRSHTHSGVTPGGGDTGPPV